jgi:polyphenol oxidase
MIRPKWPAPHNVHALTTTITDGNLADHVDDDPKTVAHNRKILEKLLPSEPQWLVQTHSNICIDIDRSAERNGDAVITRQANKVLVIMTADCVPIILTNKTGSVAAAIHAGWRGLNNGVIDNTIQALRADNPSANQELIAWVGPHICEKCYQVGQEMHDNFAKNNIELAKCFYYRDDSYYANLSQMAEMILSKNQMVQVVQSKLCTFEQDELFYSYRREAQTGRIATMIWFT